MISIISMLTVIALIFYIDFGYDAITEKEATVGVLSAALAITVSGMLSFLKDIFK